MTPRFLPKALCVVLFFFLAGESQGQSVFYAAHDMTDTTSGEDLWEYVYWVEGIDFSKDQGWSVFFDSDDYKSLQAAPTPSSSDWDVLAVQPDPGLPDPGFYDAQALTNTPTLAVQFHVSFIWLGAGTPGFQPFTFYNSDFSTRIAGETTAPLALYTSDTIDGVFVVQTNAIWTVTNKTFALPITNDVQFFRIGGAVSTRIISIRAVGGQFVVTYQLETASLGTGAFTGALAAVDSPVDSPRNRLRIPQPMLVDGGSLFSLRLRARDPRSAGECSSKAGKPICS